MCRVVGGKSTTKDDVEACRARPKHERCCEDKKWILRDSGVTAVTGRGSLRFPRANHEWDGGIIVVFSRDCTVILGGNGKRSRRYLIIKIVDTAVPNVWHSHSSGPSLLDTCYEATERKGLTRHRLH